MQVDLINRNWSVEDFHNYSFQKQILRKDHMQARRLIEARPSTMRALIENVMAANEKNSSLLEQSSGIFEIGIYRTTTEEGELIRRDGHAIGMQIDRQSEVYRFWDVNSGFYSYPDFETFKRETEAYIREVYGKDKQGREYNDFLAMQYYKS